MLPKPFLALLLLLPLLSLVSASDGYTEEPVLASMLWSESTGFKMVEGELTDSENTVARANFTNAVNSTGWAYLEIDTEEKFPDHIQAYAAGFLEGHVTARLLYLYWLNTVDGYCKGKELVCKKVIDYVHKNTKWVMKMVMEKRHASPYWHHVSLFYDQYTALEEGYENAVRHGAKDTGPIPHGDIFWMNIFGDLEDLEQVFASRMGLNVSRHHVLGSGSCSALIKLLPGNADLLSAHDTWNSYQSMLRILKRYRFNYHWTGGNRMTLIPGRSASFSSYPGVIYSGDDFNVIPSSGLVVIETTIGNSNKDLWDLVKPTGQVLEGVRATVANRLAMSGKQWTNIFSRRNSGTYNNQWMVVDYKLFKKGKPVDKNTLWVLEQLPGHIHSEDASPVLSRQTYWPSYNTPYFKDIFNMSGSPENVKKFGDWFTYERTPRALIFKRDHKKVRDIKSMTRLMRYNNFKQDPLSRCDCTPPYSGENAISARNDLNPKSGKYPFAALGHRSHGGTDMKLVSSDMLMREEFVSIGGPTYDNLPPFQWSKVDFGADTPHYGHPDLWKFGPIKHSWAMK